MLWRPVQSGSHAAAAGDFDKVCLSVAVEFHCCKRLNGCAYSLILLILLLRGA